MTYYKCMIILFMFSKTVFALDNYLLISLDANCLLCCGELPRTVDASQLVDIYNKLDEKLEIRQSNEKNSEYNSNTFGRFLRMPKTDENVNIYRLFDQRVKNPLPDDSRDKQVEIFNQRWHRRIMLPGFGSEALIPKEIVIKGLVSPPVIVMRSFVGINQGYVNEAQGIFIKDARFTIHELTKPYLFHANGGFYSVFSDCMVAKHRIVEEYPFMPVISYGYNTMHLLTADVVPVLTSAGQDKQGRLWLVSRDGFLAFFDTENRQYLEGPDGQEAADGALVARDNRSASYFVPLEAQDVFREYFVDFNAETATRRPGRDWLLPHVQLILYSDERHIVYADELLKPGMAQGNTPNEVAVKRLDREINTLEILYREKLGESEHIYEGVYLPEQERIFLLLGIPPAEGLSPYPDNTPDWKNLRLATNGQPQ